MAHDENLAARVRKALAASHDVIEKRMFGGVAFLVGGNMSVGVHRDELVVRVDPEETDSALAQPGVRVFDITGRPMRGWLLVSAGAVASDGELDRWVRRGVSYARSLPAK